MYVYMDSQSLSQYWCASNLLLALDTCTDICIHILTGLLQILFTSYVLVLLLTEPRERSLPGPGPGSQAWYHVLLLLALYTMSPDLMAP